MPSKDELEAAKSLVSRKYLGKAGIHAVGLRRSKSAVTIYVDPAAQPEQPDEPDQKELLRSIEKEIEPVNVLVVEEERASIK